MECKELLNLLEEWMDAELAGKICGELEEHLKSCSACRALQGELQRERALYASFSQTRAGYEPSPALWAGLERELRVGRVARKENVWWKWVHSIRRGISLPRLSPALALLLLVLAVGVTVFFMRGFRLPQEMEVEVGRNTPPESRKTGATSPETSSRVGKDPTGQLTVPSGQIPVAPAKTAKATPLKRTTKSLTPRELIRRAERDYLAAISLLERDMKKRPAPLDPQVEEPFKMALATIDRTILETRNALRGKAEDPVAAHYLLAAYAKKVELLEEMATY